MLKILLAFLMTAGLVEAQAPILIDPTTGQYLGNLSANKFDPDSVNNPVGRFGSPTSPQSINNHFNQWGSPYSPSSVRNPYAAPVTQPRYESPSPAFSATGDTLRDQLSKPKRNDDDFEQILLMGSMINSVARQQAAPPPLPPMPLLDFSKTPATREEFDALPAWKRATFEAAWNGAQFTQGSLREFVTWQMVTEIDRLRVEKLGVNGNVKTPRPYLDFSVVPATKAEFDALPEWRKAVYRTARDGTQFTQETLQRFVIEQMAKEIDQLRAAAKSPAADPARKALDRKTAQAYLDRAYQENPNLSFEERKAKARAMAVADGYELTQK